MRASRKRASLSFTTSMSTGFVRSVGFIPLHWRPRLLLSGYAYALVLALALMRFYLIGTVARPWW